jgi:hypothetical protein
VRTSILTTHDQRPTAGEDSSAERTPITARPAAPARESGTPRWLEPEDVAARAVAGIRRNEAFIITHPGMRPLAAEYFGRILAAYDGASD